MWMGAGCGWWPWDRSRGRWVLVLLASCWQIPLFFFGSNGRRLGFLQLLVNIMRPVVYNQNTCCDILYMFVRASVCRKEL
ncbi:hypothetical protein BD769DRAFT_1425982 [Suillus cothurnatus]|nr:hypothetical protein BD769DRAFT_1425982 [Suillus cothurnatus]